MKDGISTVSRPTNDPRRTMAPGTARKPASTKSCSDQPSNLEGTLSNQLAPPGPPVTNAFGFRRNDRRTAFLTHSFTVQLLSAFGDAARNSPLSISSSASVTASRASPLVAVENSARASHAELMADSSAAWSVTSGSRQYLDDCCASGPNPLLLWVQSCAGNQAGRL